MVCGKARSRKPCAAVGNPPMHGTMRRADQAAITPRTGANGSHDPPKFRGAGKRARARIRARRERRPLHLKRRPARLEKKQSDERRSRRGRSGNPLQDHRRSMIRFRDDRQRLGAQEAANGAGIFVAGRAGTVASVVAGGLILNGILWDMRRLRRIFRAAARGRRRGGIARGSFALVFVDVPESRRTRRGQIGGQGQYADLPQMVANRRHVDRRFRKRLQPTTEYGGALNYVRAWLRRQAHFAECSQSSVLA